MGYNVHITRKKDWADDDGPEISLQEWTALIESDTQMRLQGFFEAVNPKSGERIRVDGPGIAVWTGHSRFPSIYFDLSRGTISVKRPDQEVFAKMACVAQQLSARVMGDEGELYDERGGIIG